MLTPRISLTMAVLISLWSPASAQSVYVSPGLWDRPEWRRGSFTSPLGVETTYRRVFNRLSGCFAGYSFRILGSTNHDRNRDSIEAEILVVKHYRQLIYGMGDIYFAFRISPGGPTRSTVDSYQSTRFSEVFVAAAPGWLAGSDAPCRIR